MGAGILPVTLINNKVHLLFGREQKDNDTPGWSDFAGGTENNESLLDTAVREGTEELTGFLGKKGELRSMLMKYGTYNIDWGEKYRIHIFPLEYDPSLVKYYNNNQRFLQRNLPPRVFKETKIFEKAEIRWIPIDKLMDLKRSFRSYYQNIIPLLNDNRPHISSFVKKYITPGGNYRKNTRRRMHSHRSKTSRRGVL
jgi:8-oxo-dGTP pyrophosphatase MutT (NUDIX family)